MNKAVLQGVKDELLDIKDALEAIQGIVGDSDNINNGARYLLNLIDDRLEGLLEALDQLKTGEED